MAENRILYASASLTVGQFRCPPHSSRWEGLNVVGDEHLAAFPCTSVVIQHAGRESVLANPNHVMFYGPGARYRRVLHDARGDRCIFVVLRQDVVAQLLRAAGLTSWTGQVPFDHGPSDPSAYLELQLAARNLSSGVGDLLQVEEAVYTAVTRSIENGLALYAARRPASRNRTEDDHHRLVESAKAVLTERTIEHDSLDTLARLLHTSVFHLGRVFRERTGFSLHAYRTHLRLRLALDRLTDRSVDLSALALELGFNSHSHFTGAFRSVFGAPPSEIRTALDGRLRRELRKTVEAPLPAPS
jgi:AraC family transcriptional regulator